MWSRRGRQTDLRFQRSGFLAVRQFFKSYFGFLRTKHFLRFIQKSKKSAELTKLGSVISSLERRLLMVFYRSRYVQNLRRCVEIIKGGYLRVNNRTITCPNYLLKLGDMVQLDPSIYPTMLQARVQLARKKSRFAWRINRSLYIRQRIGVIVLKRLPNIFISPTIKRRKNKTFAFNPKFFYNFFVEPFRKKGSKTKPLLSTSSFFHERIGFEHINLRRIRKLMRGSQFKHLKQRSNKYA